jgi:hypothetical protein
VSAAEVDAYLDGLEEPKRSSLRALLANLTRRPIADPSRLVDEM